MWYTNEANGKLKIYTDHSKIEEEVGSTFVARMNVLLLHTEITYLEGNASVFQTKIYDTFTWFIVNKCEGVDICVDSQATLIEVCNPHHTNKMIMKVQDLLHRLRKQYIRLHWIRA